MGDRSRIAWTEATWNPTTGCDRVSPGCAKCYALTQAARMKAMGVPEYQRDGDPRTSGPGFGLTLHPDRLDIPLRWTRPRLVFVDSMSDLFHPEVPDAFIGQVWNTMALASRHTFQVLTKRPERMRRWVEGVGPCEGGWLTHNGDNPRSYTSSVPGHEREPGTGEVIFDGRSTLRPSGRLADDGRPILEFAEAVAWPTPNVWLGTSVENARWRTRIDELRATPAAVRFLSCEPLLGPLAHDGGLDLTGIDWIIVGGESGPGARPMELAWARNLRDAAAAAGARFFFKQLGSVLARELGVPGKGARMADFPEDLRLQEMPVVEAPA